MGSIMLWLQSCKKCINILNMLVPLSQYLFKIASLHRFNQIFTNVFVLIMIKMKDAICTHVCFFKLCLICLWRIFKHNLRWESITSTFSKTFSKLSRTWNITQETVLFTSPIFVYQHFYFVQYSFVDCYNLNIFYLYLFYY